MRTDDVLARPKRWHLSAANGGRLATLLLGLLVAAYVSGCMVGQEQERDQQQHARRLACEADPHCLKP